MAGPGKAIVRCAGDEAGAVAVEYGLIAALVAVAAIAAIVAFGSELTGLFDVVAERIGEVIENAPI